MLLARQIRKGDAFLAMVLKKAGLFVLDQLPETQLSLNDSDIPGAEKVYKQVARQSWG